MKHNIILNKIIQILRSKTGLGVVLLLIIFLSLFVDETGLIQNLSEINKLIVFKIRVPRILTALTCGGSLALAGVLLQALLRNPLADPFVLGVSGGGSVTAMLSILLGFSGFLVVFGAFFGALASVVLLFLLAYKKNTDFRLRLILSGIILASLWFSAVNFILILSPTNKLPGMLFWLMGDLSNLEIPWVAIIIFILAFIVSLLMNKSINLLTFGNITAQSMGLSLFNVQWILLIISSILVANVVSIAGNIGFVGLVVPHLVRLSGHRDHKQLIPNAAIAGMIILVVADWLSRIIFVPIVLPVGILTTFLGVPLFIYLLRKTNV